MPPERIPADLDARAALYRDRLADTRTLILLDNAVDEAQVLPLLPAAEGCLVLITSRRRFNTLDGAVSVTLDVLPLDDAVALLRRAAGLDAHPVNGELLERVAQLCGCLPLALSIAAALVRGTRWWSLGRLADRLAQREPGRQLAGYCDGRRDLAAVFDLSYRALGDDRQKLFRRLGLTPGPDIDAYATSALLGIGLRRAEYLLQDLVDHSLLTQSTEGRYRMHDLLRLHARDLVAGDPDDQRSAAIERVLDYYQHTAQRADAYIAGYTRPGPVGRPPTHAPVLADPEQARGWLREERDNLEAWLKVAQDEEHSERVLALSAGLVGLSRTDGPWARALQLHELQASAADRLGDRRGCARALTDLGVVRRLTGDYQGAQRDQQQALKQYEQLGDRYGQATVLTRLGVVRRLIGDHPHAQQDQQRALALFRELGDRYGQARSLDRLGAVRRLTGDYTGAADNLEESLALFRDLGDRYGQARSLTRLGEVRVMTGDYADAEEDLQEALRLFEDLGDRRGRADVLTSRGEVRRLIGDYAGAMRDQQEALEQYEQLGDQHGRANALARRGAVRRLTRDRPGAAQDLQDALKQFRKTGSRGNEVWALNHYAAVLTVGRDVGPALALYREALRLSRQVKQPDDEALALEGISECLLHMGKVQQSTAHLHQALAVFQRLGMRPDAKRAQTRLADLNARHSTLRP